MIHPALTATATATTDFSFSGYSDGPAGCEALIRAVRLRAFQDGQLRNREWMAGYASTLFAGEALQWHARLSEDVQLDWRALEQALMDRYIPPQPVVPLSQIPSSQRPPLPTIPTTSTLPPAYDQLSVRSWHRPGVVRVIPTTPGSSRGGGWIARAVDSAKCHTITNVMDDALRIQCTSASSTDLQPLKIVSTSLSVSEEWLGIRWYDRELKLPMSDHFAYIFRLNGPESTDSSSMCKGPIRSTIWHVEINGTLSPCWVDGDDTRHVLDVVFNNTSKRLAIVGDYNAFTGFNRAGYTKVRLVLEPS